MRTYFRHYLNYIKSLIKSGPFIVFLAKQEIKNRFSSSALGIFWAFFYPLFYIFIIWYFMNQSLRSNAVTVNPITRIAPAIIAWNFFAESVQGSVTSLIEYAYLLKNNAFRIELAIIVKLLATIFIHIFFLPFLFFIEYTNHMAMSFMWLQVFYYFFATACLVLSIAYIGASLYPFFRDMSFIIGIFIQIGFWTSPILWSDAGTHAMIKYLVMANPMAYIINGYRESLENTVWFWHKPAETLYFWAVVIVFVFISKAILTSLKPHFAEVIDG